VAAGLTHLGSGAGRASGGSAYFYSQEDAFAMMDLIGKIGSDANLQTQARGINS
jgi:pyruvate/oxaloacetate carboxyltransferase